MKNIKELAQEISPLPWEVSQIKATDKSGDVAIKSIEETKDAEAK